MERVIFSGGNILPEYLLDGVYGNINLISSYKNKVAEAKVFIDVKSLQCILGSKIPIVFVPLNATNSGIINSDWFRFSLSQIKTMGAKMLYHISSTHEVNMPIWDLTVALVMAEQSLITSAQDFNLQIEQELNEEDDQSGKLIVNDVHGVKSNVILKMNVQEGLKLFLDSIKILYEKVIFFINVFVLFR
ncbi:MAG: nucleoside hydrolase [Rickettsiaceae bacterium H1]|nr:nucleoside hydrolase [Rickettsiaceae bacterium H1]